MDQICGIRDSRAESDPKRARSARSCKDDGGVANPTILLRGFLLISRSDAGARLFKNGGGDDSSILSDSGRVTPSSLAAREVERAESC